MLAVIVILAVIALISIPQILKILNSSRISAAEDSVYGIVKSAENYVANFMLQNTGDFPSKNIKFSCNGSICSLDNKENYEANYNIEGLEKLSFKGTTPNSGKIVINNSGKNVYVLDALINGYTCNYTGTRTECINGTLYKEEILNGADPIISGDLVPVIIENDGTVKKADISKEWYKYENKTWANAVILKNNVEYKIEEVIPEENIKQYYVWIPRYRYQLWNVNSESLYPNNKTGPNAINIQFESVAENESNGTQNGEWLTHPAFTNFETNGIWVGKYEISYDEETYTNPTKIASQNPNYGNATNSSNVIIKPNVRSLTNKNVSSLYMLIKDMNQSLNSHMIKNSEWGAITYLTYSNYGKCTNGTCSEVYINNVNTGYGGESAIFTGQWQYSGTITGCSGDSISASMNSNNSACETGYSYISGLSSTTGNISGVYDMSGGAWEYVMGIIKDANGNVYTNSTGFKGKNGRTGANITTGYNLPDSKYFDLYLYNYDINTDIWYDYSTGHLGDATKEVAVTGNSSNDRGLWYSDYAHFSTATNPVFERGGYYYDGTGAGLFYFARNTGGAYSSDSSRAVLAY